MLLLLALIGPVICLFSETSHKFSISEEALVGSLIGRLPLQDGINYRPSGLPKAIRLQNTQLFVGEPLDREQAPSFSFSLVSNSPPAIIHISVVVEDVNDNAPSFPLSFQNVSVLETASIGTRLPLVGAVDLDEGDNGRIVEYRLDGEAFKLVEKDGLVFLQLERSLDREQKALYSLNLTAKDGGNPQRTGSTVIYVQVLDVNDNAPEFPERKMVTNWKGQISLPIASLNAVDHDEGDNGKIHYEILGSSQNFEIANNQLFAKNSSPACCSVTPCSECVLVVRATDEGNPPLSSTVEIVVRLHDDNQHDPEIHFRLQPSHVDFAVISSDAEVGKALAVLTVTDDDGPIGETGYLKLIDDEEGLFALHVQPNFYILRLAGKNFTQSEYHLLFEAADGQVPVRTTRKSLTVYHEGKKTSQKKYVQMAARIREDVPKGSFVVQIGANSTADRFQLVETKDVLPVEIDKVNGIVTTLAESLSPGRVLFDVSVFPPPPAVQPYIVTVDLLIEDVNNHAPEVRLQQELELPENTPVGAKILDFEVIDKDLGVNGKTTVRAVDREEYFKVMGNSLFLKKELDYEDTKRFDVLFETVDYGKPPLSTRKILTIFVTDINDNAPYFPCPEYHFTISVSSPVRSEIGRMEAKDVDSFCKFSYFLLDPTLLFAVNPKNGVISTLRDLEVRTYKIRIAAKDEGGLVSNNVTVFIHSTGLPIPVFENIPDKIPISKEGDVVMKLNGSNIKTDSDLLLVDSSGAVKLSRIPSKNSFWIPFKQEINGVTTSTCVQFERHLPSFPNFNKKVELNLTSSTPLGLKLEKIKACDHCDYSTDCPFLAIDSKGILTLSRLFTTDKMMCSVLVHDGSEREEKVEVVVRKSDLGEEFRLPGYFEFFVDPDLPLGTIIGHLPTSVDHNYSVKKQKEIGVFPDGVLYIRRELIQKEVYSFEVEAIHRRLGNRHRTEVWIRTGSSFETSFSCPQANFSIKENNLAGKTVGFLDYPSSFKIRQLDSLDNILLTPIGRVVALTVYDAEKTKNKTANFELIKGNSKIVCSLLIDVHDENEFAPVFERKFYRASFRFGNVSGVIDTVKATDNDRDDSGVTYKLMSHQHHFTINQSTGDISVLSSLPLDSIFNVSIRASDNRKSPLSSLTFFLITVEEDHDLPIIFLDNSTIRISPSAPVGSVVGRIVAVSGQQTLLVRAEDKRFLIDSFGFITLTAKAASLPKQFEVNFTTNGTVQRRKVVVSDQIIVETAPSVLQSVSLTTTMHLVSPPSTSFVVSNGRLLFNESAVADPGSYQVLLEDKGSYSLVKVLIEDSRSTECGSNIFLVDQLPEMVKMNCWTDDSNSYLKYGLKNQIRGISVQKDGTVKIEKLEEIVTKLDVEVKSRDTTKQIALILIRNKTDPSISFPSDHFNLLLSSSLENNQSFGRVAAESDSHLNYYLFGSDALSVKQDTGELVVTNITDIRLNPEARVVTLVAANRVGIFSVKVKNEIVEDTLFLSKNTFIFDLKSSLFGSVVGEIDLGRRDVTFESLDDRFFIRERTLYLKSSLKNETKPLLELHVEVRKGRISSKVTVYVLLTTNSELLFKISENLPKGTIIGELPEGLFLADETELIELDATTRFLKTTETFDREKTPSLNFTLQTETEERLFAHLVVEDENDNAPTLELTKMELAVAEDLEIGAALTRIRFSDPDMGDIFHFTIESGNELDQFSVDRWGLIRLEKSLDFEKERMHHLKISVKDGVAPFKYHTVECEVVIKVLDVNDTPPRITSLTSFTVSEDSPVGTTIGTLTAHDPDSTDLLFRILPESLPYAEFLIHPISGLLQVNKELDYEKIRNYEFLLEVSDDELSSSIPITVAILDKNDNPPRFEGNETAFTVKETASVGQTVTRMKILDQDGEDNARCTFWLSGDSKSFLIGEYNGIIVVAGKFDYEKTNEHKLVVHARNIADGAAIISRRITIWIEDENDEKPRFVKGSPQTLEVFENLPGSYPTVISTSVTEDGDKDDSIAYSLLHGNTSLFSVDVKTGDILLLAPLDREETDSHQLTVLAKDSSSDRNFAETEIKIRVLDDNDHAPSFLQPYYQTHLTENTPNGTEVLQVVADDPDLGENGEVNYKIFDENVPFVINKTSGVLRVNGQINREEHSEWEITVAARDGGRFDSRVSLTTVSISIEDENDNFPVILNSQMDIFIDAKTKKSQVVHVVDAVDPDLDNIQFSLSGPDSQNFEITKNGEVITLLESLLMKSFYTLTVTAEDAVGHTATSTFTFYVDDAVFPVFSPMSPVQIAENTEETVAVFRATTQKAKNKIQYSILSGNDGSFEIGSVNGVLKTVKLDRERRDYYKIWIRATDSDTPPKSSIQSIQIRVLDQNDNKPRFSQPLYRASVRENEEPGEILAIKAFDEDLGKNAVVSYSIQGNEDNLFSVDRLGRIRNLRPLDREAVSTHRLTIRATDSGHPPLFKEAVVVIDVEDEDDNSPKFTRLFHAEVLEDMEIGSEVVLVTATDSDESSSHNFSLEDNDDTFVIDQTTGMITLRKELDREKIPFYRLRVRLEDGVWTVFTSVQITVMDINDNIPVFDQPLYIFLIGSKNDLIGQVTAMDYDEGTNGHVSYTLLENHPEIVINPDSGQLSKLGPLTKPMETVTVVARDSGIPSRSANTAVLVLNEYQTNPVMILVFSKSARRGDVVWKINSSTEHILSSPYFNLTNGSFKLSVDASNILPFPPSPIGTLVHIQDGSIYLTHLAVKLLNSTSLPPKFLSSIVKLTVPEVTLPGARLGSVSVKKKEWVQYTIDNDIVTITETGEIVLNKELYSTEEYRISVNVTDLNGNTDSATLILKPSTIAVQSFNHRLHPLLFLGSRTICLPAFDDELSIAGSTPLDPDGCIPVNDSLPETVSISLFGKILNVPVFDVSAVPVRSDPKVQSVALNSANRIFGTRLHRIESAGNCTFLEESILNGYCLTQDYLEVCELRKRSFQERMYVVRIVCANGSSFVDLHILPKPKIELHPAVIHLRENSPGQTIGKLNLDGDQDSWMEIADPEMKKLFKIEENVLSNLVSFDRELKSFYNIPLKSSKGDNYTLRIIIDDILDSPFPPSKDLSVNLFGQIRKPAVGSVQPASLDTVHDYKCIESETKDYKITSSCKINFYQFPENDKTLNFNASSNNAVVPYGLTFSQKTLRLLRLHSALRLNFFGPPDGMAMLFSRLHSDFPDLKFYPVAVQTKETYFHTLVMGIADRHDKVVTVREAQSVVDSCLASHPVLELIPTEKLVCSNYSMKVVTSGRHLGFRGVDSLWFLPEGRVDIRCIYGNETVQEMKQELTIKEKTATCSRRTCSGICSLEEGKIVCLTGDKENVCGDTSAISLENGHLDLIPTQLFSSQFKWLKRDCNDSSISIEFKAGADGVLLSAENSQGLRSSLEISAGVPVYRIADGFRTPAEVPLTKSVTDQKWHILEFKMTDNGRRIILEVDGIGREAKTKKDLPHILSADLKLVQIGAGNGKRFAGCIRRVIFNEAYEVPLHGSAEEEALFSISAVGHISWSNRQSDQSRLSSTSLFVIAAISALLAVILTVYGGSKMYFRWKNDKGPAWQETRDIDVRHLPKNSSASTTTDSNIYEGVTRSQIQETCFERAPTLPVRKIRTVGDVNLAIPRAPKYYRNDGYV